MHKLLAYLQLCRLPAVFTAMADIFLGYLLTRPDLSPPATFGLLLAASSGLYLSGMVFNDVFDHMVDAAERPHRPIPSGRVPVGYAISFGGLLMAAGVAAAAFAGWQSALVAFLLVWCIFLYNALLKNTPLGPLVMGSCRFLNVMLGASTAIDPATLEPTFASVWSVPQIIVALGLGIYIVGVTWFARREAAVSSRAQLAGAIAVINVGLVMLIGFVFNWQDPGVISRSWNATLLLAAIGVILNHRLVNAWLNPSPTRVQAGVRTLLLSLVMLDATLVFFINEERMYAFAVVLLLVPAKLLGRFMAIT